MPRKRDWLQIVLNVVSVSGCIFLIFVGFKYPENAINMALTLIGSMALIVLLDLALRLFGKVSETVADEICRIDDRRRGVPSDFSLADRLRLRLLSYSLLAKWWPHLWDRIREDIRRNRCCEVIGCWNDPICKWDQHRVCLDHHSELENIASNAKNA